MLLSQHVVTCSVRVMYLLTIIFHFTIHASLTFTCPRFLTSVIRLFGYIFFSLSSYYILLKFRFKACLSIPFPPLWSIWKSILTKSFFYTFASSVNFPSYSANLISIHVIWWSGETVGCWTGIEKVKISHVKNEHIFLCVSRNKRTMARIYSNVVLSASWIIISFHFDHVLFILEKHFVIAEFIDAEENHWF